MKPHRLIITRQLLYRFRFNDAGAPAISRPPILGWPSLASEKRGESSTSLKFREGGCRCAGAKTDGGPTARQPARTKNQKNSHTKNKRSGTTPPKRGLPFLYCPRVGGGPFGPETRACNGGYYNTRQGSSSWVRLSSIPSTCDSLMAGRFPFGFWCW